MTRNVSDSSHILPNPKSELIILDTDILEFPVPAQINTHPYRLYTCYLFRYFFTATHIPFYD